MPVNRSSSDSSGGGALLVSGALEATPQREVLYSTKSSDSPSDDEMALVQASNKFNQLVNDANSYRPAVAADEYHQGNHLQRPSISHPTAIVSQSIFAPGSNGVPPNIASSPLYRGFGDIQARLVTAQQYVRITPGFNNDQAKTIQSLLVGVGQDLTHFATTVIQEHTKSQHQAGELRVQYEKAQSELISRRKQISELQEQYKDLVQEKELERKTVASLERQIESHQNEVRHLQKLTRDYDQKHMKQIQILEDEIKSLRMSQGSSMELQLMKISNAPKTNNKPFDDDSDSDGDDFVKNFKTPSSRRKSSLNPTAPEFGPRGLKTDHSKEMLPLLRKYANEGVMKTAGRLMETQDARAYENNSLEPPKRTGTRMEFRGSSVFANGHSNAFGAKSNALVPSGPQTQSRFKSIADFANIDFSKLQNKDSWEAEDITLGFVRLFGMIEGLIAKHHVNAPFNENDSMLSISHPATWNYILSMGLKNQTQSASHMIDLLTKFDCRHWVLKRILVDYIINRLIVPEIFFGFSSSTDHHLTALQGRMRTRGHGQSRPQGLERQRIVTDHAKVIQFIVEAPDAQEFKQRTVAKHVEMLHEILKPMRSCAIEDSQARKALTVVVNAAWTITTKIWSSGMTLHFYFPETGSKFAYGTMRSLNYTETRSDQMQYQQYRIMLVVTPTLSLRDDRDMDRLRTHELLKSDVLVMR